MKRCFVKEDSREYWIIEATETCMTITTDGQMSHKLFDSDQDCERESQWMIKEKMKSGFVESDSEIALGKIESKKYSAAWSDDPEMIAKLAEIILTDSMLPELKHITIGNWGPANSSDPGYILEIIVMNKEKFQHIESLFVGDMGYEECEISWICQCDYSEVLKALPNLKSFTMKGVPGDLGENLDLPMMEEISIICGGLPRHIVTQLISAKLPNLKKLVLYLGVADYGLECEVDDLENLAKKELFPNLKYLGFLDSAVQDEILEMMLESDILPQLEVLDMSCGCLTDFAGLLILDNEEKFSHLKLLNASYHYMSEDMMNELKALPFEIDLSDPQESDEENMWPMITE